MTNQLQALDDLIAKVADWDADPCLDDSFFENWRSVAPHLQTDKMISDGKCAAVIAVDAANGSLDAAKALHEALLPGWSYGLYSCGDGICTADVFSPPREIEGEVPPGNSVETEFRRQMEDRPVSRALLISILKAYYARLARKADSA